MNVLKRIFWKICKICIGEKAVKRVQHSKIIRSVQENGEEAFHIFSSIAEKHHSAYSLTYGTLLGAYRDKGLIPHDEDMDIMMPSQEITVSFVEDLLDSGFVLLHAFIPTQKLGCHLAFKFKGMKFDIYPYRIFEQRKELSIYVPTPIEKQWHLSYEKGYAIVATRTIPYQGFKKYPFLGVMATIPQNEEDVLKIFYGDSFMTPIYDFKGTSTGIKRFDSDDVVFKIGSLDDFKHYMKTC